MSRAAYERVKQALVGTPLEGELERLNTELHLTPESPEWTIAALAIIGNVGLKNDLDATRLAARDLEQNLPDAMKAAGGSIVAGLASQIATETKAAIVAETVPQIIDRVGSSVEAAIENLQTTSKDAVTDAATLHQQTLDAVHEVSSTVASLLEALRLQAQDFHSKIIRNIAALTAMLVACLVIGLLVGAGVSYFMTETHAKVFGCKRGMAALGAHAHWSQDDLHKVQGYACTGSAL